jgi:putative transposase
MAKARTKPSRWPHNLREGSDGTHFPAEHWMHLRTTNVIESVFATVRLRTEKTKGSGTRVACLTMVFKLMQSASRRWRALNGSGLLSEVIRGTVFVDGMRKEDVA